MEELFKLMSSFRDILIAQLNLYKELLALMDEEEAQIAGFSLKDFERTVTQKDQLVQRATKVEQRRLATLKKICDLISFDSRGESPSLKEFLLVLQNYTKNVERLLPAEMYATLRSQTDELEKLSVDYFAFFETFIPRRYRNQQILKKMEAHVARSRAIYESEANLNRGYENTGKSAITKTGSKLQVKA